MQIVRNRLFILTGLVMASSTALAQSQQPAADTLTEPQVRALLTERGYTDIDDLDFEDGMWETDATSANGKRVDVLVNPATGDIKADALVSNLTENDVKAKLTAAGYSEIHDVDFDDGMWKAEAERASDGDDREVHLDAATGRIVYEEDD